MRRAKRSMCPTIRREIALSKKAKPLKRKRHKTWSVWFSKETYETLVKLAESRKINPIPLITEVCMEYSHCATLRRTSDVVVSDKPSYRRIDIRLPGTGRDVIKRFSKKRDVKPGDWLRSVIDLYVGCDEFREKVDRRRKHLEKKLSNPDDTKSQDRMDNLAEILKRNKAKKHGN